MPWSGSSPNQTFSRTDGTRNGATERLRGVARSVTALFRISGKPATMNTGNIASPDPTQLAASHMYLSRGIF